MNLEKYIELPFVDVFLKRFESEGTRRAYQRDLEVFKQWCSSVNVSDIKMLNIKHIIEYKNSLSKTHSVGTVNRRLSCVKSYLTTLILLGVIERNAAEHVSGSPNNKYVPTKGMTDKEASNLLTCIDSERDRAIIGILLYLGLRRSEVCSLKISSLQIENGLSILVVVGKGNRLDSIPIPNPLYILIQAYFNVREVAISDDEPLFFSVRNGVRKSLTGHAIYGIFQRALKKSKASNKYSPHSARVTCVSNAIENGATLIEAQRLGRWASVDMVARYNRRKNLKESAVFKVNYDDKKSKE